MKKFLLSLSLLIFFAGCGTNTIVLEKDTGLVFNFGDKSSILRSKIVSGKNLTFSTLDIRQHILEDDNNRILFYEEVFIDDDYDFKYNPLNSIIYIFNAKRATVIFDDNTVLMVQVELQQREFLNIMVQSNNVKKLSYVYGFSNYEFKKIAKELTKDSDISVKSLTKQGIGVFEDDMSLSRWSETKLLVKPFTSMSNGRLAF